MGAARLCYLAALFLLTSAQIYDFKDILERIPHGERRSFVEYHLGLGQKVLDYNILNNGKIPEDLRSLPQDFSVALLEAFMKKGLVQGTPRENVICFPNGECIDIDDPGVHPYLRRR